MGLFAITLGHACVQCVATQTKIYKISVKLLGCEGTVSLKLAMLVMEMFLKEFERKRLHLAITSLSLLVPYPQLR